MVFVIMFLGVECDVWGNLRNPNMWKNLIRIDPEFDRFWKGKYGSIYRCFEFIYTGKALKSKCRSYFNWILVQNLIDVDTENQNLNLILERRLRNHFFDFNEELDRFWNDVFFKSRLTFYWYFSARGKLRTLILKYPLLKKPNPSVYYWGVVV